MMLNKLAKPIAAHMEASPAKSPEAEPKSARVPSVAPGDVPSEDNQPQDLHTLHAHLKGLVPDHLHEELGHAIAKHTSSSKPPMEA